MSCVIFLHEKKPFFCLFKTVDRLFKCQLILNEHILKRLCFKVVCLINGMSLIIDAFFSVCVGFIFKKRPNVKFYLANNF